MKQDATIKMNCAPRGDQPIQIRWFKEGLLLAPSSQSSANFASSETASLAASSSTSSGAAHTPPSHAAPSASGEPGRSSQGAKYSQLVQLAGPSALLNGSSSTASSPLRHQHDLVLVAPASIGLASSPTLSPGQRAAPLGANQEQSSGSSSTGSLGGAGSSTGSAEGSLPAWWGAATPGEASSSLGVASSELTVRQAERADSGAYVCVARNNFGQDKLTYRLIVQGVPDAPASLRVASVQATSVQLLWWSPFDGNLPITHYLLEHRRLQAGPAGELSPAGADWVRTLVEPAGGAAGSAGQQVAGAEPKGRPQQGPAAAQEQPQPQQRQQQATLGRLTARSSYQVRVAAANAMGQGAWSPLQLVTTAEEAPQTRVQDLRAQPVSSSALKLVWRAPLSGLNDQQAPVRGFHISHRPAVATSGAPRVNPEVGPQAQEAQEAQEAGWLVAGSLGAANLSSVAPTTSGEEATQQRPRGQVATYEWLVQGLRRNSNYELRVQPFNAAGVGPAALALGQTLRFDRPSRPTLRLVAARRQSLELRWSLAARGHPLDALGRLSGSPGASSASSAATSGQGLREAPQNAPQMAPSTGSGGGELASAGDKEQLEAPLMGFSLFYKCEFDDWRELQLGLVFQHSIEGLRCGNKYQIYLSAFNQVGRSEPSDVLNVRTEGSAPVAPKGAHFFAAINSTEVVLELAAWHSGGCPISSFMIQFKRLHEHNWFILSEQTQPFVQLDRVTLPDLSPASHYRLLVSALNEAGRTDAEYTFATLTPDGQQLELPVGAGELAELPSDAQAELGPVALSSLLGRLANWLGLVPSGSSHATSSPRAHSSSSSAGAQTAASDAQRAPTLSANSHTRELASLQSREHAHLLLPLSCALLLLLVLLLASYLYSHNKTLGRPPLQTPSPPANGHKHHSLDAQHQHQAQLVHAAHTAAGSGACATNSLLAGQLQLMERRASVGALSGGLQTVGASACNATLGRELSSARMDQQQQQQLAQRSLASYMLDSILMEPTGNSNQQQQQQQQSQVAQHQTQTFHRAATMKLLHSQHSNQQAPPSSSSLSTRSTSCAFEGPGSSAGASSSAASNKLPPTEQPKREDALLVGLHESPLGQSGLAHLVFGQQQPQAPSQHVDLLPELELDRHAGQSLADTHFPAAPQTPPEVAAAQQQSFAYEQAAPPSSRGLVGSSSFACADDLLLAERPAADQHQQQAQEPIYQRLSERLKTCSLASCARSRAQYATLHHAGRLNTASNQLKSHTLRLSHAHQNGSLFFQQQQAQQQQQQQQLQQQHQQQLQPHYSNTAAEQPSQLAADYYPSPPPSEETCDQQLAGQLASQMAQQQQQMQQQIQQQQQLEQHCAMGATLSANSRPFDSDSSCYGYHLH